MFQVAQPFRHSRRQRRVDLHCQLALGGVHVLGQHDRFQARVAALGRDLAGRADYFGRAVLVDGQELVRRDAQRGLGGITVTAAPRREGQVRELLQARRAGHAHRPLDAHLAAGRNFDRLCGVAL